jgi:protein SCO1/2
LFRAAVFACFCLLLAACGQGKPAFQNTDITGAEFGQDFQLTDHNGQPRTLKDFSGKAVAVFFGFTRCPDVCPSTLAEMKAVRERLGTDADRLQVLFVTIDPERDTPKLLAEYVPSFDPSFLGLYGDMATTERTAKDFKVYYQKVPGSTPDNYSMDHTAASYLYDPRGHLRLYVRTGAGTDAITHDIKLLLDGR